MNKEEYIALIKYDVTSPTCKKGLLELVEEYFKLVEEHEIMKQKYDHALEKLEEKTVVPKRFWRKWL